MTMACTDLSDRGLWIRIERSPGGGRRQAAFSKPSSGHGRKHHLEGNRHQMWCIDIITVIYKKSPANIILSRGKLNVFLLNSEMKQNIHDPQYHSL